MRKYKIHLVLQKKMLIKTGHSRKAGRRPHFRTSRNRIQNRAENHPPVYSQVLQAQKNTQYAQDQGNAACDGIF